MSVQASIVIPTRDRQSYLEVALASVAPQAGAEGAEVVVVDDAGPSEATRRIAERYGATYEPHERRLGLNVARNTGVERSSGRLVVFLDDDVEVGDGWLRSLLGAAGANPGVEVFAGRIVPRLEGRRLRSCGREGPPITSLQMGGHDCEAPFAWGANMAIRRQALQRVGPFDVSLRNGGDEQEWQERWRAGGGGPVMYVAGAGVAHRRDRRDARLRSLMRAGWSRGAASRRFDAWRGQAPGVLAEAGTLAACIGHVARRACLAGLVMVAHSGGRLQQACRERIEAGAQAPGRATAASGAAGSPVDFLSGESGTVGGLGALERRALDALADGLEVASGRRRKVLQAAERWPPRRSVLALLVQRPERQPLGDAIAAELERSRHDVHLHRAPAGERGKFENLNLMLAAHPLAEIDWLLALDDDVELPGHFLDAFLFLAERFSLDLAQPAHRAASHAAWKVTRRRPLSVVRETAFVEIGPVTAFSKRTFQSLLPFPELRMGWGLDAHWGALAKQRGWRCGVIDAVAILHGAAPAGAGYSRDAAIGEARTFLAEHPYIDADEAQRTLVVHRRW